MAHCVLWSLMAAGHVARLRLCTVELNGYLFQIGIENNPDWVERAEIDDASHYLLECSRFAVQRETMVQIALETYLEGVGSELLLCALSC